MMSGKEWLIYTARLALLCLIAIAAVIVLFFLVAGILAYPFATGLVVGAFIGGMWFRNLAGGPREWLHHLPV